MLWDPSTFSMAVENLNALWMVYKAVDSFRLELGLGNSFAFWSSESHQILGAGVSIHSKFWQQEEFSFKAEDVQISRMDLLSLLFTFTSPILIPTPNNMRKSIIGWDT
jgi:hypothetical protein